jgi:hypothetical protein
MRACKSWGLALFIALSVATFFIAPSADDIEAVAQIAHVQFNAVEKIPKARPSAISTANTKSPRSSAQYSSQRQTSDLLNLICLHLC